LRGVVDAMRRVTMKHITTDMLVQAIEIMLDDCSECYVDQLKSLLRDLKNMVEQHGPQLQDALDMVQDLVRE
jgi:hypothetical protein